MPRGSLIRSNDYYRNNNIGVIHKVPSEWLPLRKDKKIISAKITKKASVDFLGHIQTKNGPLPLAFDVKEVSSGDRWYLIQLKPHQFKYLSDSFHTGAFAFILIGFWEMQKFFILPFSGLEKRWMAWKKKEGPASIKIPEKDLIEVKFLNYLNFMGLKSK